MPPHHHHHHHHHHHGWYRPSEPIRRHLDRVEGLLDPREGRELAGFAFEDGPDHRRASASVLCAMVSEILEQAARSGRIEPRAYDGPEAYVELELPPHMRHYRRGTVRGAGIPTRLLSLLSRDERELDDMIGALAMGPGHDVAANAILMRMLETLFDAVTSPGGHGHSAGGGHGHSA